MRSVIADSALLSSMGMYAFLLRPGLAALDNLADKFVAGWLLPSKVLDLSYPIPPLPPLVFAIQSDEGRQLAGRSTASRRRYRGQDSILIVLEYQSIITVKKLQLWFLYSETTAVKKPQLWLWLCRTCAGGCGCVEPQLCLCRTCAGVVV